MRAWLWLIPCLLFLAPDVRAQADAGPETLTREQRMQRAAEAADLFSQGKAAFEGDDLSTALDRLTRSYALWPDHRNAALLGQIELALGDSVAAATHLDDSVRRFPRDAGGAGLERVMAGLKDAREKVGTLRVHSPTLGAHLWVDGAPVGALPLERDLYVAPGFHRIEVRAPGYRDGSVEETIAMGASRNVELTLERLPSGAVTDDPTNDTARGFDAADTTLVAGGVLTLLGLGAGVGLELWARDAEERAAALRAGECSAASRADCVALREQGDRAAARHDFALTAFLASSALGVLTVGTYAALRANDEPKAAAATVGVRAWASPQSLEVGLGGGFW